VSLGMPDAVSSVLATALDGLATRQNVIADNIANVDTPGFRATSVDFESSLLAAIQRGQMPATGLEPVTEASNAPVGSDGNNVDLRQESLSAVQTQFQYQMMSRAVSDRFALVSTAAGAF
jgi:flagellar basal-body rod protein FlgB